MIEKKFRPWIKKYENHWEYWPEEETITLGGVHLDKKTGKYSAEVGNNTYSEGIITEWYKDGFSSLDLAKKAVEKYCREN